MQWTLPWGTVVCEACKPHEKGFAARWELPPLPPRGAPIGLGKMAFGKGGGGGGGGSGVPQDKLGRMLCVDCWEAAHPFADPAADTLAERSRRCRWIKLEGGRTTAAAELESGRAAEGEVPPPKGRDLVLRFGFSH